MTEPMSTVLRKSFDMMTERAAAPSAIDASPLLSLRGVKKSFGGVHALMDGQLDLYPGSVTALIGENGAGKSTLVKILTGVLQPDAGEIRIDGKIVQITSPAVAQQLGISVIHQESVVFDALSVAENIFITARPRRHGLIDWARMRRDAAALLTRFDVAIDPALPVRELSVAQKHLVQIARALSGESRIVIMDEPTAALSQHESDDLFRIVRQLQAEGRAILFIGHKFEEIFAVADRYAIFRDGSAVDHGLLSDTTPDQLISRMVGRALAQVFPPVNAEIGNELLRVENLSRPPEFRDISFAVHRGEILGVYGLVGAGRSEVMQTLFGLQPALSGRIFILGSEVRVRTPKEAIAHGLALVPEDRQHQGAILNLAIADNVSLANLNQLGRGGFISRVAERAAALPLLEQLQIKAASLSQRVRELSGGNQQKVVLAKWLATQPRILILDEPTKGIDVGAKAAVHQMMRDFVRRGFAIIMISSELPEILGMSNRILVMSHGRSCARFERSEATPENIVRAAAGV
jgi:rhamnose transport system ATP-binding protein